MPKKFIVGELDNIQFNSEKQFRLWIAIKPAKGIGAREVRKICFFTESNKRLMRNLGLTTPSADPIKGSIADKWLKANMSGNDSGIFLKVAVSRGEDKGRYGFLFYAAEGSDAFVDIVDEQYKNIPEKEFSEKRSFNSDDSEWE